MRKDLVWLVTVLLTMTMLNSASSAFADSTDNAMPEDPPAISTVEPYPVHSLGTRRADEIVRQRDRYPRETTYEDPSDGSVHTSEQNGIKYVTGGIGDEERGTLNDVKNDYNLHILSAGRQGEFVGDTQIIIRDGKGSELVNTSAGPLFYAKLPPGTYAIETRNEGYDQLRRIVVSKNKPLYIHLTWR